jgi:hypothetical protein
MEAIMQKLALLVGVFILLALGLHGVMSTTDAAAQGNIPCYRMQGGARTIAASGCSYEFESGSSLSLEAGATFTVTDFIRTGYKTALSVTDGSTITPTGTIQRITAAATTGTSAIANPNEGRILVLVNIGSNTITLTDTGTLKLSGNAALGQFDNITLIGDGTNWIEISETNN